MAQRNFFTSGFPVRVADVLASLFKGQSNNELADRYDLYSKDITAAKGPSSDVIAGEMERAGWTFIKQSELDGLRADRDGYRRAAFAAMRDSYGDHHDVA